ncbi:MAG TPA: hypothetical protein VJT49_08170 [Amycolatopsis sp.]|nr:hypothetical protein [Amycolatopsis sp.]HKS45078.1 hypothetical protein [Amycolatopsis sp.]
MTEPTELSGIAEAARLLDDQTQQLTPVPAWLNEVGGTELPPNPPDPRK